MNDNNPLIKNIDVDLSDDILYQPASSIQLTDEQHEGLKTIEMWLDNEHYHRTGEFKLGGYAGTGKTTLIKYLVESLGCNVIVTAFTGKACHVLQRKGIEAQTLHSLMYRTFIDPSTHKPVFMLKVDLKPRPDLIIVDEASMVSRPLYNDLKSFDIPILFVGDPGQLEPIGDNPNLMKSPDYVLKTIHRQAAENPILKLAHNVRAGRGVSAEYADASRLIFDQRANVNAYLPQIDQIICAMNKTRMKVNDAYRKGRKGLLEPGEKLICLRNNRRLGIFNGMMFNVRDIVDENASTWECIVEDESGPRSLSIWKYPFEYREDKIESVPNEVAHCDYGYAITCHKAQGSEWDNVMVIDEWMPPKLWDGARWKYTAITRAAKRLVYIS